jgi:hypothetical protein
VNVLDHPAYSTDLAPRDLHLFCSSRNIWLAGQKFDEGVEVKNEVATWLRAKMAEINDVGIQELAPTLKKMPRQKL